MAEDNGVGGDQQSQAADSSRRNPESKNNKKVEEICRDTLLKSISKLASEDTQYLLDIDPGDLKMEVRGQDFVLVFPNDIEVTLLLAGAITSTERAIEFKFPDGTVVSGDDFIANSALSGLGGSDTLFVGDGTGTINGNQGGDITNNTHIGCFGNTFLDAGSHDPDGDMVDGTNEVTADLPAGIATDSGCGRDILQNIENLTRGAAGNDNLTGKVNTNELLGEASDGIMVGGNVDDANVLTDNATDDILKSGADADIPDRGVGSDTVGHDASIVVEELDLDLSTDTDPFSEINSLQNIENVTDDDYLVGNVDDANVLTDNATDDTLNSGNDDDILKSGVDADIPDRGVGSDTVGHDASIVVEELDLDLSTDTDPFSEINSLQNIENVTDDDYLVGNVDDANVLTDNATDDTLKSGVDADIPDRGVGSDTVGHDASIVVEELDLDLSTDTDPFSEINSLQNIENVTDDDYLGGNVDDANVLTDNATDDTLKSGVDADIPDRGVGSDTVGHDASIVVEELDLDLSTDTDPFSEINSLQNIENVTDDDYLVGNVDDANVLTDNATDDTLNSGNDDDILKSGVDADIPDRGVGSDTVGHDASIVVEELDLDLSTDTDPFSEINSLQNIENVTDDDYLVGNVDDANVLTDNATDDTLNSGNDDDILKSGVDADIPDRGVGSDTVGHDASIVVEELDLDLSTDTDPFSEINSLQNIENVTDDDYLVGNVDDANVLTDNATDDTLNSGNDDDILKSGVDADIPDRGVGSDTVGHDASIVVEELDLDLSTDTDPFSEINSLQNIENVTDDDYLGGNVDDANVLTDNATDDTLNSGNDDDILKSGADADIPDRGVGSDTVGHDASIVVEELDLDLSTDTDPFSEINSLQNIENVTDDDYLGGNIDDANVLTDNATDDTLNSGNDDDILKSGADADILDRGVGSDTVGHDASIVVEELDLDLSTDTDPFSEINSLQNIENVTDDDYLVGNVDDANVLTDNATDDTLNSGNDDDILKSGADADILDRGVGSDTVGHDASIVVEELDLDLSTDTDPFSEINSLQNIENVTDDDYLGGNVDDANVLTDNATDDTLNSGNDDDILKSGADADILDRGVGSDTVGHDASIVVEELDLDLSTDTDPFSEINSLQNIENVTDDDYLGGNVDDANVLTDNATDDTPNSGNDDDILKSGADADILDRGVGSDTVGHDASIVVEELDLDLSTDTDPFSEINSLQNIENVTDDDYLGGNVDDANVLTDNATDDTLNSGNDDVLAGGPGANTPYDGTNSAVGGPADFTWATGVVTVDLFLNLPDVLITRGAFDSMVDIENIDCAIGFANTLTEIEGVRGDNDDIPDFARFEN